MSLLYKFHSNNGEHNVSNDSKVTCRSCYHEPIRNGRFFALQEVIAPVSIEDIEGDGFFNGWHCDAAGTPRLRQGDHMKVYQGHGSIGEDLSNFTIEAESEFVVLSSEVNDVRVKRLGAWLMYEDEAADNEVGEYSKKWNPGKQVFEIIENNEVVAEIKDKADAMAIVAGTKTLADAA